MADKVRQEYSGEAVKVLVADDSRSMRGSLEEMLRSFSYVVELASDGKQCLETYLSFKPHIILLDMHMPGLDGLQVIEHIRKKLDDQDTLIIMLTSDDAPELKLKAFGVGANDYLHKPFDRPELLARVAVAAKQMRMTTSLRRALSTIEQEMDLVASLQLKLLPETSPRFEGLEIRSLYEPSGRASGDYFDHFRLEDGVVRLLIADVSGHGARAAFIMSIVRTLFRTTRRHYMDLPGAFSLINQHLVEIIGRESDFVTCLACDVDLDAHRLKYINAGHCPGMLKFGDGKIVELASTASVLGFFDMDYRQEEVELPSDADLFMFTDGFYDWEVEDGRLLDFDEFWDIASPMLGSENFLEELMRELDGLSEKPCRFRDDLTALTVAVSLDGLEHEVFHCRADPQQARGLVKRAMEHLGRYLHDESVLYDLDLALTEACANVVKHAYPNGRPGDLEVRLSVKAGVSVAVEVTDWGVPMNIQNGPSAPGPEAESGRGLYIIAKLMDEYELRTLDGKKTLYFKKNIGAEAWKA
jgi:sigma-B regulation protein RsbU (phosphoserine phosphatase)